MAVQRPAGYFPPSARQAVPGLDAVLPRTVMRGLPLAGALAAVGRAGHVGLDADWAALATVGVKRTTPVTVNVEHAKVSAVLTAVLRSAGGGTDATPVLAAQVVGKGLRVVAAASLASTDRTLFVPGLTLAKLDRFEAQTRPFDRWVEFDGLPSAAGQAATVAVHTSDEPQPLVVTLADGVTVEVIALGNPTQRDWWTPTGRPMAMPPGIDVPRARAAAGERGVIVVTRTRLADGTAPFHTNTGVDTRAVLAGGRAGPDEGVAHVTVYAVAGDRPTFGLSERVALSPPVTAVLAPRPDGTWDPAASVQTPGPAPAKLSDPRQDGDKVAFDIVPAPAGRGELTSVDYATADGSAVRLPFAEHTPNTPAYAPHVVGFHGKLADLKSVTLSVARFDDAVRIEGLPTRAGVTATPTATIGAGPATGEPSVEK